MKCRNCGSELVLVDGVFTCQSCGSKFSTNEYFEDVEAYLCYVEADESGRRTKDSAIAQEVYQILEDNKISTFYKRISLESISGADAEKIDLLALNKSKVVLIIALSKEHFSQLLTQYSGQIENKKIIPVFWGMDAYDIPKELNAIQALKYDSVGAAADLTKGVLRALGRKQEIENYEQLHEKQTSKGLIIAAICTALVAVAMIAAIAFKFVILPSRSNSDMIEDTGGASAESEESRYLQAVEYIDQEQYADAINILSSLTEYKDSEKLLNTCYAQYAGYYVDENTGFNLHLQMYGGNNGSADIYCLNDNGDKCTVSERILFESSETKFDFNDSENNTGSVLLKLENDSVKLDLSTADVVSEVFLPNVNVDFLLSQKTDMPIKKTPDLATIKEMLTEETTIGAVKRKGYELSYVGVLSTSNEDALYRFDNTDIYVAALFYDIKDDNNFEMGTEGNISNTKVTLDDPIIVGVKGPASLLISDKVGKAAEPYLEEDYIFNPGGEFSFGETYLSLGPISDGTITDSMGVCVCAESTIGKQQFIQLIAKYIVGRQYSKDYNVAEPFYSIEPDGDTSYVVYMKDESSSAKGIKYSVQTADFSIQEIGAFEEKYALPDGKYGSSLLVGLPWGDPGDTTAYISFLEVDDYNLHIIGSWDDWNEEIDYNNYVPKHYKQEEMTIKISPDAVFYTAGGENLDEYMDKNAFLNAMRDVSGSGLGLIIEVKDGQIVSMCMSS